MRVIRTHLRPLRLHTPHAARPVDDRVLWDELTRVHLAAGTDDAAAGQDDVPADLRWRGSRREFYNKKLYGAQVSPVAKSHFYPSK